MSSIHNEIFNFYKIKNEYEKYIKKKKKKFIYEITGINEKYDNDDERKKAYKNLNNSYIKKTFNEAINNGKSYKDCKVCKNKDGLIFLQDESRLQIKCSTKKCSMNTIIEKPYYYNIDKRDTDLFNEINELKKKVIKIKLDLIFKFSRENETLQKFEEVKDNLIIKSDNLLKIRKKYYEIIKLDNENLEENNKNIIEHIRIIKQSVKEAKLNKEKDSSKLIEDLTAISEAYTELYKLLKDYRNTKFKNNDYISDPISDSNFFTDKIISKLIQNTHNINDLYIQN